VNLALFLTPKATVAWMPASATLRDALERMEKHGFSAVPVLDRAGVYLGTLTEGDLLRAVLRSDGQLDTVHVGEVPIRSENRAVLVVADIEAVVQIAVDQNFVPVVDSRGVLMGIVTRKRILEHLWRPPS
jgi:CBS domain-containing protein